MHLDFKSIHIWYAHSVARFRFATKNIRFQIILILLYHTLRFLQVMSKHAISYIHGILLKLKPRYLLRCCKYVIHFEGWNTKQFDQRVLVIYKKKGLIWVDCYFKIQFFTPVQKNEKLKSQDKFLITVSEWCLYSLTKGNFRFFTLLNIAYYIK